MAIHCDKKSLNSMELVIQFVDFRCDTMKSHIALFLKSFSTRFYSNCLNECSNSNQQFLFRFPSKFFPFSMKKNYLLLYISFANTNHMLLCVCVCVDESSCRQYFFVAKENEMKLNK